MWEHQPNFNDIYLQHLLSIVNKYSIRVSDDIVSSDRRILFNAGERLNEQRINTLLGRELIQPVGMNLFIDIEFGASLLQQHLQDYFQRDPVLWELYQQNPADELVERGCRHVCAQAHIRQYLWMLWNTLPRVYERGLFCGWFTAVLGMRKNWQVEQVLDAFTAGLLHDIGLLLVLVPGIPEHEDLSAADWQHIQSHPRAGYELLCFVPHYSEAAARAVLEHHEEVDGTGYPGHKVARQLAPLGQMIHLLDSTHAIYVKYFKPRCRTLHDIIPILQMNPQSQPGQPAAELIVMLRKCRATDSCSVPLDLVSLFITQVKERHVYIKDFVDNAERFLAENPLAVANTRLYSLSRLLEHIVKSMHQSGLINDAYMRWLDQVEEHQLTHAYREVEDVFLMMQEVLYLIQRFILRLSEMVEENQLPVTQLTSILEPHKSISLIEGRHGEPESGMSTKESLEIFKRSSTPSIPTELRKLWLNDVRRLNKR